jgi:hypothetical protein
MQEFSLILVVFQLLAYSSFATDSLQTQHWIAGTPQNPTMIQGIPIFEANPILAGYPEKCEPYFKFWAYTVEALPKMLSPPLSTVLIGYLVLDNGRTVLNNDRLCQAIGLTRYLMLSWRWSF